MRYHQLTSEERYMISALRKQGIHAAEIARNLGRHPSTICREVKRNSAKWDGRYRPSKAVERTNGRRSRCRKKSQFGPQDWRLVNGLLQQDLSPEQASGLLRQNNLLSISHETIYRHVKRDRKRGGLLYKHLRFWKKKWRKLYRSVDSRGRLPGKRMISERPAAVEDRSEIGHWEIDTVMGRYGTKPCIVTLVERKTGFLQIGKIATRTMVDTNRRVLHMINRYPDRIETITADNGTEFHGYAHIEELTDVKFYFAQPYHSWERGTNENTNGLIRQYLPKGTSMEHLTQHQCNAIADKLNNRPRKRHDYRTPAALFNEK
jgi:transposase, IS30 family